MAQALRSGDQSQVDAVVAMPTGHHVPAEVVRQLAGFQEVVIDPSSFVVDSHGVATVKITVVDPHGTRQVWESVLIPQDNRWKIAGTSLTRP